METELRPNVMKRKIYQADASSDKLFMGNPAAVCPLVSWPDDELMQNIAAENNLAETAFYVKREDQYEIRWFTPAVEVDLCGHATLATAHVLLTQEGFMGDAIRFFSPRSGILTVKKQGDFLMLDFPSDIFQPIVVSDDLIRCFDVKPLAAFKGKTDFMLVFEDENQIKQMTPNLEEIAKLAGRGVIVTAKGDEVDFVARFFAPQSGINEDPVTGSADTTLIPYWCERLGKVEMTAVQLSQRRGFIKCKYLKGRVEIGGQCKLYMTGEIYVA